MKWQNFLTSGHSFGKDEYYLRLKFLLFNLLMLTNILSVGAIFLMRLMRGHTVYAVVDAVYVVLAIAVTVIARTHRNSIETLVYLILSLSYMIITFVYYTRSNPVAGISWYVVLVIIAVIFKGRRDALIVSAVALVTIGFISTHHHGYSVSDTFLGLIPFVSSIIIVIVFDRLHATIRSLLEQQKDKYVQLSRYDGLTDVLSRSYFFERLETHIRQSEKSGKAFALLFADLNDFKIINDRYGHLVGDAVLAAVSRRLKTALRKGDVLARYGGDEFALILPNFENKQHLRLILNRLLDTIREPVNVDGQLVHVTLSVGVALSPRNATDRLHLIKYADEAMYVAKQIHNNAYCFYEDMPSDPKRIHRHKKSAP